MNDDSEQSTHIAMERDFMNTISPHEKWLIFKKALEWAKTRGEINNCLQNEVSRLREENSDMRSDIISQQKEIS